MHEMIWLVWFIYFIIAFGIASITYLNNLNYTGLQAILRGIFWYALFLKWVIRTLQKKS